MKLLVSADWHLGAGTSLGRTAGDRLEDQRAVTQAIATLAADRDVQAILLAGDLLNGPHVTPEQLEVLADFAEACEMPIVATVGNGAHDASMREVNGLAIFDRLPGISVYSRPALHDLGPVQVACLPWVSPARLVASMDGDVDRDRVNARAAELLVKVASGIADTRIKPTVLMLHGSLSGASLPTGIPTDDLREPVIPVEELLDIGFAAIVAGHIHAIQYTVGEGGWQAPLPFDGPQYEIATPLPLALYTGSPLPLNFGETNTAHGCWLLDVGDGLTRAEFVPIPSRPLVQIAVDVTGESDDDALAAVHADIGIHVPLVDDAIVKLQIRCTPAQQRRLDLSRLREAALAAGAHTVKIEVEAVREQRSRVDGVTGELGPVECFDAWAAAGEVGDTVLLAAAREQFQADLEQVGA